MPCMVKYAATASAPIFRKTKIVRFGTGAIGVTGDLKFEFRMRHQQFFYPVKLWERSCGSSVALSVSKKTFFIVIATPVSILVML